MGERKTVESSAADGECDACVVSVKKCVGIVSYGVFAECVVEGHDAGGARWRGSAVLGGGAGSKLSWFRGCDCCR